MVQKTTANKVGSASAPKARKRRKPGPRPSGVANFCVKLRPEEAKWASKQGKAEGSSRSGLIRRLIREERARLARN